MLTSKYVLFLDQELKPKQELLKKIVVFFLY